MTVLEEIKKALEGVGPLKVEFTPDCDEFNAIIAPINDDYDGTFFTVIGCGDKQDKLGGFMAIAVNAVPELLSTLESLQRENETVDALECALQTAVSRAEAAEAEVKRLQAEIDRKSSMPGDHRYWEGRYRDEAAEKERMREALQKVRSEFRVEFNGEKIVGISHDSQSLPRIVNVLDTALASTGGENNAE